MIHPEGMTPVSSDQFGNCWCVWCGGRPHKDSGTPMDRCRKRVLRQIARIERLEKELAADRTAYPEYTGPGE